MSDSKNLKIGVFGAKGNMGREVIKAVQSVNDLEFVAGVDINDSPDVIKKCDVAVDFTAPSAVMEHIKWGIENNVNLVIGTTGFNADRLKQIESWLGEKPEIGILIAPNFSIGAVLMMKFAEQAAPYYESVEIVELHHPKKVDAPSGTSAQTAKRIAKSRKAANLDAVPDATQHDDGARGAVVDGIHIHAVRLSGLTAHQEVLFGGGGETLQIRHDSYQRSSFMPGVLAGIRYIPYHFGLTVGIESAIGL